MRKETTYILLYLIVCCLMCYPLSGNAQSEYKIKSDIERAVKDFFYKVSEMNNPVEPVRPEDFAAAYQKGINVFQVNNGTIKMVNFLSWYKKNILQDYSISHKLRITEITKLKDNNRYSVKGVLERKIEDDTQRRRIEDEPVEIKVVWRGQEFNNVSIQSMNWDWKLNFAKPNIIKEYELSLDRTVSYVPAKGGTWEFEITSRVKSMEGFNGEERICVGTQDVGSVFYNQDNVGITNRGNKLSGYIGPNKSKTSKGFLIVIEQNESKKMVLHCIYQPGKDKD